MKLDNVAFTLGECVLIEELVKIVAEINSAEDSMKNPIFEGISNYVEGIKYGLNFKQCTENKGDVRIVKVE